MSKVEFAYRASGRRVAAIPELLLPFFPDAPVFARWRIQLESPVTAVVEHTSEIVTVSEVYVGLDYVLFTTTSARILRGLDVTTVSDPIDSLPDIGVSEDGAVFIPVRLLPNRPRLVETITFPASLRAQTRQD